MAIEYDCPWCGHHFVVPERHAGAKLRCRSCDAVSRVPGRADRKRDDYGVDQSPDEPLPRLKPEAPSDDFAGDEVRPKKGKKRRRRRDEPSEMPVLGVPVEQAPWVFAGILATVGLLYSFTPKAQGISPPAYLLVFLIVEVIHVAISTLVIVIVGGMSDVEASSLKRLFSIALALAAAGMLVSLVMDFSPFGFPALGLILNLAATATILSVTLRLGCLGVVGFMFLQGVVYVVIGLFFLSFARSFS